MVTPLQVLLYTYKLMFKITLHPFLTDSCRSRKCLTLLKPSLTAVLAMIPVGFLPLRFLQNEQLHWLQHGGHTDTERELGKIWPKKQLFHLATVRTPGWDF